jgi:hypothetical protein
MYLYVVEERNKSLSLYILLLTPFPGGKKRRKYAGICRHTVNYVYGEKERVIYEKDPEPMPISQTHTHTDTHQHTLTHRPARCIANTTGILCGPDLTLDMSVRHTWRQKSVIWRPNPPSNILTIQKIRNVAKTRNVNKHLLSQSF